MKLFDVYPLYNLEIHRAKGAYVFDKSNQGYLDFYGGHAVISIGHSHPHYVAALVQQLDGITFYSNSVINPWQTKLANQLGKISGLTNYALFLVNSGAEANENALKLASFHNQHTKVISFHRAFHGRTSAAVNITDNASIIAPINRGFENIQLPLNEVDALEKEFRKGDICAVIIEGIQGIGGVYEPHGDFLRTIQKLCHENNTLFIMDEIQSGYARSGDFFAFQKFRGITPDIITVAKGMGNGFPIGGVLIHPSIHASYGLLGTTFGGNHLACRAGLAVLEVIKEERLISHTKEMGIYLKSGLQNMDKIKEIRGRGLMLGIEFDFPIRQLREDLLFRHQVFVGSSANKNTLRLLPPLTIQQVEADQFLSKLDLALESI